MVSGEDLTDLATRVERFAAGLADAIRSSGLFALTPNVGPLLGLYLSREQMPAPTNFTEARELCDSGLYGPFFHAMLAQGVALAPGAYEILFTSLAHSDEDLERTIACAGEAALVAASS
jgi:glutamate-1-semialdehyde 2,1-aminomutase